MTTKQEYTAKDIKTLDQITHVRKRVGMYLGSASDAGITTAARELLDNAVDEALSGHGNEVIMRFFEDGSTEVEDHARGLPIDKNAEGINGIILTVGTIGSGVKFGGKDISGGLNGVGASASNSTSSRFDVTVYRDGSMYELSFQEGRPGFFDKPNDPTAKFTPNTEIKISKDPRPSSEKSKHPSGTKIRFWPDFSVFVPGSKVNVDDLRDRLKSTAFLVHGLTGIVEDNRDPKNPVVDKFHFNAGLLDMLPTLTNNSFVTKPVHLNAQSSFTELTNVLQDNGHMKQEEVVRNVDLDVAFAYTNTDDTILNSYVNIIQTRQNGTHVDGLWRALSREIIKYIESNKFLKVKEEKPTIDDVRTGFTGIISVKFPEPVFSGQAKESLATSQITTLVSQSIGDEIKTWLNDKKNTAQAKALCSTVVENKRIREAAKQQKDTARKKSALESSASMPAKLVACASADADLIELWLCEGDSALGGLKQARDSNRVAIYPLRGKPLNVFDTTMSRILENKEWSDFIQILGAGSGKTFDVSQVNYKKVILLADAVPDGDHIAALLTCGIWKLMPEFIKAGYLYVAMPPLFSITTTGKAKERHYALNQGELDKLVAKLTKEGKKWDKVQRHKGLGEYAAEILDEVVNDPETRVLKQITVNDIDRFESTLELAFGSKADPRKDWIVSSRHAITEDDLDF